MYKKNTAKHCSKPLIDLINHPIIMRLFSTLLIVSIHLSVFAFGQKVTLKQRGSLISILKEIKKQSGYNFLYDASVLSEVSRVKIDVVNSSVPDALNQCLKDLSLSYTITANNVIISKGKLEELRQTTQEREIYGKVSNEKGEPLERVTVTVKGTSSVTTTNAKGEYKISVVNASQYLLFTIVGYKKVEAALPKGNVLNIVLKEQMSDLTELVVIGYGTSQKKDLTGSVSTINVAKELKNQPAIRIDQLLQGRAAGVDIKSTNGAPGAPATIRIRGARSVTATNEPIYVIDGIVDLSGTNLTGINPADIESIDILKDASTTAIYGSRAANGVILVTTKQGKVGKEVINFSMNQGIQDLPRTLDLMDAREFAEFENEARFVYGKLPPLYPDLNAVQSPGTNWTNEVVRVAPFSNYNLSFSDGIAGDKGYTYFLSGNVVDQKGIIRNTGFKRYQGRLNFNKNLSSKLSLGVNVNVNREYNQLTSMDFGSNLGWSRSFLTLPPTMPVYKPDGSYETFNPIWYTGGGHIDNPVAVTDKIKNSRVANSILGNFSAVYEVIPGLKLKSMLGINFINRRNDHYNPSDMPSKIVNNNAFGFASSDIYNNYSLINENTINYVKTIGQHNFEFLAGTSFQTRKNDRLFASGDGLTNDVLQYNNLSVTEQLRRNINSNLDENTIISFLGRANYNFDKRYYLTLTGRQDGASNFASNKKWGFFPSAAIKWRVSNENFYQQWGVKNILSDASVRLSYGLSGNQGIGNYASLASLSSNTSAYLFGGNPVLGYTQGNLVNSGLSWETTSQLDAGLDLDFFNGRLNVAVDHYRMLTRDLLLTVQIPTQTGYGSRLINLGKSKNQGFDFAFSGDLFKKTDFSWRATLNVSTNKQEVTDLGPLTKVLLDHNDYGASTNFMEVGIPIGSNYGVEYAGTWKSQAEIDLELAKPKNQRTYVSTSSFYLPGKPRYLDYNKDGQLNTDDYHYLSQANPKIFGGIGNSITYKRATVDFFFQYSQGAKMYNTIEFFMGSGAYFTNQFRYMVNRWSESNPTSDIPGVESRDNIPNTRFLHDSSFIRLKSAQLTYNLSGMILKKHLKNLNVFLTGTNLFLITKYNGFDPEVNKGGGSSTVIAKDDGNYPNSRTVTFGLNVTL